MRKTHIFKFSIFFFLAAPLFIKESKTTEIKCKNQKNILNKTTVNNVDLKLLFLY